MFQCRLTPIRLSCGFLFNHKFSLLDNWGEIADNILYGNQKYFSSSVFTNISTQYTTERTLYNPQTYDKITLTANNLLFTQNIINGDEYEQDYKLFYDRVKHYIVPNILCSNNLIIRRIGIVYAVVLNKEQIRLFSQQYFKSNADIIDFRFSKKETTINGLVFLDKDDYINKIYTVGSISDEYQGIIYDYQLHFSPLRSDVRDCIDKLLNTSLNSFNKDIISPILEGK